MIRKIAFALTLVLGTQPTFAHDSHAGSRPAHVTAMSDAANSFLATLSDDQRKTASRPFDDDTARTNWNYLPSAMVKRDGIPLGELDASQRIAVHAVFGAALSSQGYGKAAQIMWLDDILHEDVKAGIARLTAKGESTADMQKWLETRDSQKYWLNFFGEPGTSRWGWMISGHHLAANFTVVDGRVAFTPLFLGASPQTIQSGRYAGRRTLQFEIDRAFSFVASLTDAQRSTVIQSKDIPAKMFADKGRKNDAGTYIGLPASRLDEAQRIKLMSLIREYVGNVSDEAAAVQMASIKKDGMKALHFAWWGAIDDSNKRFMYRIHGPSVLIEFVREAGEKGAPGNHVHSIVRDPRNDYGEDWLKRHYSEQHQP